MDLHEQAVHENPPLASKVRLAFLRILASTSEIMNQEDVSHFLIDQVEPDDFAELEWQAPEEVITFCERLYRFRFDSDERAEQIHAHVNNILRHALRHFEQHEEMEYLFRLLQIAPTSNITDTEVLRLRGRAHLYEVRNVQKKRRWLYGYLVLQVLLIGIVFPFLFIWAENGALQERIEETADVNLPEEGRQYLSYIDGLYWSTITAGSIGYGDITPQTTMGRMIAAVLGTMGVITIGVVAGLILSWLTPRRLD